MIPQVRLPAPLIELVGDFHTDTVTADGIPLHYVNAKILRNGHPCEATLSIVNGAIISAIDGLPPRPDFHGQDVLGIKHLMPALI